jgi:hypothetical protein
MHRGDPRAGKQWVLCVSRLDAEGIRGGEVSLCARVSQRGEPQIVVEVKLWYFKTWRRVLMAKLLERWPWLPFSKPRITELTHSTAYPRIGP